MNTKVLRSALKRYIPLNMQADISAVKASRIKEQVKPGIVQKFCGKVLQQKPWQTECQFLSPCPL